MVHKAAKDFHPHVDGGQHALLWRGHKRPPVLHPGKVLQGIGAEVQWRVGTERLSGIDAAGRVEVVCESAEEEGNQ